MTHDYWHKQNRRVGLQPARRERLRTMNLMSADDGGPCSTDSNIESCGSQGLRLPRSPSRYSNEIHGVPDEPPRGRLGDTAVALAADDFPVFPIYEPVDAFSYECACGYDCSSPAKHPRIHKGLKNATTEASTVEDWWADWPRANIAVRTGAVSAIWVLDVDPRHGGDEALAALEQQYGQLPRTLTQITGSGGRHLVFNHPGDTVPNSAGKIGNGLDVRGDGGYILVAPSRNLSGPYIVLGRTGRLDRSRIVDAPDWLLELARANECHTNSGNQVSVLDDTAGAIPHGSRNCTLASLAGTMRNRGMSQPAIEAALQAENQARCQPPLAEAEVTSIAASIGNYDPGDGAAAALPQVILPGGSQTISQAAGQLGELLADTGKLFQRGGVPVGLRTGASGGRLGLEEFKPVVAASTFETVASLVRRDKDGQPKRATCSESVAKQIINAQPFIGSLPEVVVVSPCPVMVQHADGQLVAVAGYNAASKVLASGEPVENMPLDQAVVLLRDVVHDFDFATPGDRSRALAAMITPALVQGGLLNGRAPVDVGEADASQSGKGYRNKLTAAIYNDRPMVISPRKGGVGSLDEAFSSALLKGNSLVSLDNVRGRIDSPTIESALTEDVVTLRVPFGSNCEVDPRRVVLMLTSNKAELTADLANRCSFVRIRKRSMAYAYRAYPEGDILDHIRANQPLFLGAVFAVVRAWHEAGQPKTSEVRHDFRAWARTLDWIVQEVFDAAPLLDGHEEVKIRISNPALNWVRDVALAVFRGRKRGRLLMTHQLLDLLVADGQVEIPGVDDGTDVEDEAVREMALRALGRRMGQAFGTEPRVVVDGVEVQREETTDNRGRPRKQYRFQEVTEFPDDDEDEDGGGHDGPDKPTGSPPPMCEMGELTPVSVTPAVATVGCS
jgi:hypothetical protein